MTQTADTARLPVFLHTTIEKKQINVFFTNRTAQPFQGFVRYRIERADGRTRGNLRDEVKVPASTTVRLIFFDRRELHERKERLCIELFDEGGVCLQRTTAQGKGLRQPKLCDPKLDTAVFLRAGRVFVSVRAACYAENVTLSCGGYRFSENGFSLFAGEEKTVELLGAKADFAGEVTANSAFDRR